MARGRGIDEDRRRFRPSTGRWAAFLAAAVGSVPPRSGDAAPPPPAVDPGAPRPPRPACPPPDPLRQGYVMASAGFGAWGTAWFATAVTSATFLGLGLAGSPVAVGVSIVPVAGPFAGAIVGGAAGTIGRPALFMMLVSGTVQTAFFAVGVAGVKRIRAARARRSRIVGRWTAHPGGLAVHF